MSSLSLYAIEDALMQLIEMREDPTLQPDERAAVEQTLAEYVEREVVKVDNIRGFLKHCDMMAREAKAEAATQAERARLWEARADRVKLMCAAVMEKAGAKKLEGRTGVIRLKGNGGLVPLEVTDPAAVPNECCRYVGWISAELWTKIYAAVEAAIAMDHLEAGYKLDRVVDNERTRRVLTAEGGVPGARLGERGKHVEVA